jgi:hypothetical protein
MQMLSEEMRFQFASRAQERFAAIDVHDRDMRLFGVVDTDRADVLRVTYRNVCNAIYRGEIQDAVEIVRIVCDTLTRQGIYVQPERGVIDALKGDCSVAWWGYRDRKVSALAQDLAEQLRLAHLYSGLRTLGEDAGECCSVFTVEAALKYAADAGFDSEPWQEQLRVIKDELRELATELCLPLDPRTEVVP